MLIGKSYWKSVVVPVLLHGASVIDFNKDEIRKLQSIEIEVFRIILGARRYTAKEGIRGGMGTSLFETRIMKNKVLYIQSTIIKGRRNDMVEKIMRSTIAGGTNVWSGNSRIFFLTRK